MEDLDLVRQVLSGNIKAFEELVRRYETGILRFTYNMIGNRETAEDITQETFICTYNKLYTFKHQYKFSTWLYQIARNRCIDYGRRCSRIQNIELDRISIISREESPESLVEYKETKKLVEGFLNGLSDIDRHILILRYSQDNLTFCDIAEIMKMGEAAVKKRYYKAYERYEKFVMEKSKSKLEKVLDNA